MNCTCLKSLKLPLTAAFAIAAFSAQAADIYTPAAAPAYAAVALPPSWGGFYVGINGGYGGNSGLPFREDVSFPTLPPPPLTYSNPYSVTRGTDNIAGGFGGGQLGYNFQFGSFVLGVEADAQGAGIQGGGANAIFNDNAVATLTSVSPVCQATATFQAGRPGATCAGRNDVEVDWFGTVRGRIGYAFGNTLIYGTGGFAAGGVKASSFYTDNNVTGLGGAANNQVGMTSHSATNTGWTAGAGVEVKLSPSWSLKGEYQFINLGTISSGPGDILLPGNIESATQTGSPCTATGSLATQCLHLASSKDVDFHTVRVGLNYYFNAPPAPLPLK